VLQISELALGQSLKCARIALSDMIPIDSMTLQAHGDRHEQEFWPLLADRFPSYEVLWRILIVPLSRRVDSIRTHDPQEWIRFRTEVPENYVRVSMAHYSVFYYLGRAVKRFAQERTAREYPEDVLFLLDLVGDNLTRFRRVMNSIAGDCGLTAFDGPPDAKSYSPFGEINDYRNVFLHYPVIGRGIGMGKIYVPKWNTDKSASPLERAKESWLAAEQLSLDELVATEDLLGRLIDEVCTRLEEFWRLSIGVVNHSSFQQKMHRVIQLPDPRVPNVRGLPETGLVPSPSGSFSSLGSNTTFIIQPFDTGRRGRNSEE